MAVSVKNSGKIGDGDKAGAFQVNILFKPDGKSVAVAVKNTFFRKIFQMVMISSAAWTGAGAANVQDRSKTADVSSEMSFFICRHLRD